HLFAPSSPCGSTSSTGSRRSSSSKATVLLLLCSWRSPTVRFSASFFTPIPPVSAIPAASSATEPRIRLALPVTPPTPPWQKTLEQCHFLPPPDVACCPHGEAQHRSGSAERRDTADAAGRDAGVSRLPDAGRDGSARSLLAHITLAVRQRQTYGRRVQRR